MLENALLDLVEPAVILVEDAAGIADVETVFGAECPGQFAEPFEIWSSASSIRPRPRASGPGA